MKHMRVNKILVILVGVLLFNISPMKAFASEDDTIVGYEIGGTEMSVEDGQAFFSKLNDCQGSSEIKALCDEYGVNYDTLMAGAEVEESDEINETDETDTSSAEKQNIKVESSSNKTEKDDIKVQKVAATDKNEDKEPIATRTTVNYEYKNKGLLIGLFICGCIAVLGGIVLLYKKINKHN